MVGGMGMTTRLFGIPFFRALSDVAPWRGGLWSRLLLARIPTHQVSMWPFIAVGIGWWVYASVRAYWRVVGSSN